MRHAQPRQASSRVQSVLLNSVLVPTTSLCLHTVVDRLRLCHHLLSLHNLRLLNSARAWIDHGFWRLGGLLTWQDGPNNPAFPQGPYQSHASFHVLPHWLALQWRGEHGFCGWVGTVPIAAAFLLASAIGVFAATLVGQASLGKPQRPRRQAALRRVAFVAGFVATLPLETIWSLTRNTPDSSFSLIAYVWGSPCWRPLCATQG
jgi:hypothetical protein